MIFLFTVLCFFILLFSAVSIIVWSVRNGIAPMPTSPKAKKILLAKALPHEIQGPIFELGSGWGTLVFPLAKQFPLSQVTGYESSLIPYGVSKIVSFFFRQKNLRLARRDFFQEDLHEAALVVCYLYPGAMSKLKLKFEKELQPGTWVISNTFAIPGWYPIHVYEVNDLYRSKILVYKVA